jgi:hypothetical protein
MQKRMGVLLVGAGCLLMAAGIRTSDAFSAHACRFFAEQPTDRAVWLAILGVLAVLSGVGAALLPSRLGPH